MQKQQILKLIAKYSRLELDELTALEIAKETADFDVWDFLEFIKDNLDNYELKYTPNGIERFLKFCKMYKKHLNFEREKKAQAQSQNLEEKFRTIKTKLKNEIAKGYMPKLERFKKGEESYFSKFELETLSSIGDVAYLVRLDDRFELQEKIEKHYKSIIYKKNRQMLSDIQERAKLTVKKF